MPSGGRHYIPRPDAAFDAWAFNLKVYLGVHHADVGLSPDDYDAIKVPQILWQQAYAAHVSAQAAAESARAAKQEARAALEAAIRPRMKIAQAFPGTTDAERASMGITVPGSVTLPGGGPSSRPLVRVQSGQRLQHTLRLSDESTPTRRARPAGADRAELYIALAPPSQPAPADPNLYKYIGSASGGGMQHTFEGGAGGLQAHYLARWVSTTGAAGPWSETASATIAA